MSAAVEVRHEGRVAIVALKGPEPFSQSEESRRHLLELVPASKFVVVDLSGLESPGFEDIALLVSAKKAHAARWGRHMHLFKVVAEHGNLRKMLEAMQMEHILPIARSLADALAAFPRRRVLHIEPDDAAASTLELLFEANGFEVIRARSPEEVPTRQTAGEFDFVLTEVQFGGREDRDLVRRLRLEFGAPVGVLTQAAGRPIDLAAFVAARPADSARLMEQVRRALERPVHEYYETIFDLLPTPLAVVSSSGELVRVNRSWRNLVDIPPAERGSFTPALPGDLPGRAELVDRILLHARSGASERLEVDWPEGPGRTRRVVVSISGLGAVGREPHALVTIHEPAGGAAGLEPPRDDAELREVMLSLLEDHDAARVELKRANARLAEVDRLKSEIVSGVSHDLRTPITAIRGSVENLLDGLHGHVDSRQRRTLEVVLRNAKRLAELIDRLLDAWRAGDEPGPSQGRIDLREPLRLAAGDVSASADKLGIALRLELPDAPVPCEGEVEPLSQVAAALLDNALRFARKEVRVGLTIEGEQARLTVEDDGPGMGESDLGRLLDPLAGGAAPPRGLGLPLVRGIVDARGGKVWAERSQTEGGACFVVLLPLAGEALGRPA